MTRRRVLAGAAALVVATALGVVVIASGSERATSAAQEPPTTAPVERGALSAVVSVHGVLAHRARADGSPYPVINQARGTYTALPEVGDRVGCGDVLLRVDDHPVLLLCGSVPAYRELRVGDVGADVRQLNAELHQLGAAAAAGIDLDPDDATFTDRTERALAQLQRDRGADATGALALGSAVVLPAAVRIATVSGELGGPAQPGAPVLGATSDSLEVRVDLEAWRQGQVAAGDPAQIVLPNNASVAGAVDRLGAVAQAAAGPGGDPGPATIPVSIRLDDRTLADGFDQAPVRVEITSAGVADVLHVPVTSVVGKAGGGYAVEVVGDDGRRDLVAVELGVVDATAGRVQVEGELHEGDRVVVPS